LFPIRLLIDLLLFYFQWGQEKFYGRSVIEADRELVEQSCDKILEDTKKGDVAFLVVGDPLRLFQSIFYLSDHF
jgi:precorrin-2 methylase